MILHVDQTKESSDENFQTIQAAYDQLTTLHKRGLLDGVSTILIHKGDYILQNAIHFNKDLPVEIRPYKNDRVTISGGKVLSGWKKTKCNGKTVWKTTLPESVKEVPFLFVNGKMIHAARFPKKGFLPVQDPHVGFTTNDENCDNFVVKKGDFNPKWYDPGNIMIKMIHFWVEELLKFQSFDAKTNRITLASYMRYMAMNCNSEYSYYNVKEALSEPGEFYFDRLKHELLLIPEKEKFEAVIPTCDVLMRFDSGARWITLSGLHFRYAGSYIPKFQPDYDLRDPAYEPVRCLLWKPGVWQKTEKKLSMPTYTGPQGATQVPGVILFRNASDCVIRDCTIQACAWYAVQALEGCSHLTFSNNEISNMGGGGFVIGGGNADSVQKNPELLTQRIVIRNNHIHDCGEYFYSAIGVLLTHACGCRVEGNHIHDLYYSGISCGWSWGYGDSVTRENCICRNRIHDLGKEILSDMGGIYILGIQPGTHVYENIVYKVAGRHYGGWGLYADEGTSHVVFEKNIAYDCNCEGFHQHYGRENIIRYNIFAFNKRSSMTFSQDYDRREWPGEMHSKAVNVYNNVLLTDNTPTYSVTGIKLLDENRISSDCNVICDLSGKQEHFVTYGPKKTNMTLKEWRKKGMDRHSVFQDPGFRNAENRDFRLKKNSVLHDYGFDFLEKLLK